MNSDLMNTALREEKRLGIIEKIRQLFSKKKEEPEAAPAAAQPQKIKKTCKGCGKTFNVDPSWEHIPNYCKECKQRFVKEKEERQRAGEARKIRRKCKSCGKFFTFPNTLAHYPNYCNNCRKAHQAVMKEKYGRPVKRQKTLET